VPGTQVIRHRIRSLLDVSIRWRGPLPVRRLGLASESSPGHGHQEVLCDYRTTATTIHANTQILSFSFAPCHLSPHTSTTSQTGRRRNHTTPLSRVRPAGPPTDEMLVLRAVGQQGYGKKKDERGMRVGRVPGEGGMKKAMHIHQWPMPGRICHKFGTDELLLASSYGIPAVRNRAAKIPSPQRGSLIRYIFILKPSLSYYAYSLLQKSS
jgi:hypothetical protein